MRRNPYPNLTELALAGVLLLVTVALVVGALVVGPASAQSAAEWRVDTNEVIGLGTYSDAVWTVETDGAGNTSIAINGAPGSGTFGQAVCSAGTWNIISGPGERIGCPGDSYYDPGTVPVGLACVGPGTCVMEFVPSPAFDFVAQAISAPVEFGGVGFDLAVSYNTGTPATTTTTTTTTTSTTTTTAPTTTTEAPTTTTVVVPPSEVSEASTAWVFWFVAVGLLCGGIVALVSHLLRISERG